MSNSTHEANHLCRFLWHRRWRRSQVRVLLSARRVEVVVVAAVAPWHTPKHPEQAIWPLKCPPFTGRSLEPRPSIVVHYNKFASPLWRSINGTHSSLTRTAGAAQWLRPTRIFSNPTFRCCAVVLLLVSCEQAAYLTAFHSHSSTKRR